MTDKFNRIQTSPMLAAANLGSPFKTQQQMAPKPQVKPQNYNQMAGGLNQVNPNPTPQTPAVQGGPVPQAMPRHLLPTHVGDAPANRAAPGQNTSADSIDRTVDNGEYWAGQNQINKMNSQPDYAYQSPAPIGHDPSQTYNMPNQFGIDPATGFMSNHSLHQLGMGAGWNILSKKQREMFPAGSAARWRLGDALGLNRQRTEYLPYGQDSSPLEWGDQAQFAGRVYGGPQMYQYPYANAQLGAGLPPRDPSQGGTLGA